MTVAEVNAIAQAFHEGVANRDAAALARLYADDGRFLPPGMPAFEGQDAIQGAMQTLLDMGVRSLDVEPLDVREAGDLTIEYGDYTLGIEAEGQSMTDNGKYVVVHETQPDGSTKIVLDIFNSKIPRQGDSAPEADRAGLEPGWSGTGLVWNRVGREPGWSRTGLVGQSRASMRSAKHE